MALKDKRQAVDRVLQAKRRLDGYKEINDITPAIYASIAIALSEYGLSDHEIRTIITESQRIWTDHVGDIYGMLEKCEKLTGISLMSQENSKGEF